MGWRDYIVTSQPREEGQVKLHTRGFEYFEDFEPRYEKTSSLSIENSLQNSNPQETSSISSKPSLQASAPTEPTQPLQSGWLVSYRDDTYRLRGGCDERDHGTVARLEWDRGSWIVWLTNGEALPLSRVRSAGKTNAEGQVVAAWTTRECGYDGENASHE